MYGMYCCAAGFRPAQHSHPHPCHEAKRTLLLQDHPSPQEGGHVGAEPHNVQLRVLKELMHETPSDLLAKYVHEQTPFYPMKPEA